MVWKFLLDGFSLAGKGGPDGDGSGESRRDYFVLIRSGRSFGARKVVGLSDFQT